MKFCALISGGKDSIYTIHKLQQEGHKPVVLLYIYSQTDQIDSYMYQSIGKELIDCYSACLNLPIIKFNSKMLHKNKNLNYTPEDEDEVEDLYNALKDARNQFKFEGVSSGAILSNYQKNRVQNVCERLMLKFGTSLEHKSASSSR